ncbi:MAG: M28 family peptidase [Candidatus Thermoplasmatota archaeon]|nr:M28 family peptidase [Candidatus Thermoplasmatota archaeon]
MRVVAKVLCVCLVAVLFLSTQPIGVFNAAGELTDLMDYGAVVEVTSSGETLVAWVEENNVFFASSQNDALGECLDEAIAGLDEGLVRDKLENVRLLSGDYEKALSFLAPTLAILASSGEADLAADLARTVADVTKTTILRQEGEVDQSALEKAWTKYDDGLVKISNGEYTAAVSQFKNALKSLPMEDIQTWGTPVQVSYSDNMPFDLVLFEYEGQYHIGWKELVEENSETRAVGETHTFYARSTSEGETWWVVDVSTTGYAYVTSSGLNLYTNDPQEMEAIVDLAKDIYIIDGCHHLYTPSLFDKTASELPVPDPPVVEPGESIYGVIDDPYLTKYAEYTHTQIASKHFIIPSCTGTEPAPPDAPDLAITPITIPQHITSGLVQVPIEIKNNGDTTISGIIATTLSINGVERTRWITSTIGAKETLTHIFEESIITEGDVELSIEIDPAALVEDGDRANNLASKNVVVLLPDGDYDNDGLLNSEEIMVGAHWFEGEDYIYPGVVVEDDPLAGMGKVAVDGYWAVTVSIINQVNTGTYDVYMRAKGSYDGRTATLQINQDDTSPQTPDIEIIETITLTTEYKWCKVSDVFFHPTNRILVRGGAEAPDPGPKDVFIDRFLLISTNNQKIPTNPLDPDTDRDGLLDGEEIPGGTLLFEGEDYLYYDEVLVLEDPGAGFGLVAVDGQYAVVVSIINKIPAGTYDVYLRARAIDNSGKEAMLQLNRDGTEPYGDIIRYYTLTDHYEWYLEESVTFQATNRILVRGGQTTQPPGPKDVFIDSLMLVPSSYDKLPAHPLYSDSDSDGLLDSEEMPGKENVFVVDRFEYDDSPLNHGWGIYDGTGTIITVPEIERDSRVMETTSNEGTQFAISIPEPVGTPFTEAPILDHLQFDIKTGTTFWFYLQVTTNYGNYYIRYDPTDSPIDTTSYPGYIIFGIGSYIRDGKWHTITRNLQEDLNSALGPGIVYEQAKWICIRGGNYRIDNIYLHNGDMIYNTNPLKPDTDGDNWLDGEEVKQYYVSPLDPDTDDDSYIDSQDVDPLVDLEIEFTLSEIEIFFTAGWPGSFYLVEVRFQCTGETGGLLYSEYIDIDSFTGTTFTIPVSDNIDDVVFEIGIWLIDNVGKHTFDICDDPTQVICDIHLNLQDGTWSGDDGGKTDTQPGYSSGMDDDDFTGWEAAISFDISLPDYDQDGCTWWQEVNTYGTDPTRWDIEHYLYHNINEDNIREHVEVLSGEKYPIGMDLNEDGILDSNDFVGWYGTYWDLDANAWSQDPGFIHSRFSGTTGCNNAATYIEKVLLSYGLNPTLEEFTGNAEFLDSSNYPYLEGTDWPQYTSKNVVATLPGSDPSSPHYIVSAHYDSTGKRPSGQTLASLEQPGADDNACGVAVLLEIARLMSIYKPERTIKFIAFSGEENGRDGSYAYVAEPGNANIEGVINLDMFGYNLNNVLSLDYNPGVTDEVNLATEIRGAHSSYGEMNLDIVQTYHLAGADHEPFRVAGIPAITITEEQSGGLPINPNYHKSGDTADFLDWNLIMEVAKIAGISIAKLAGEGV